MARRPLTVLYLHSSSGRYGADRQLRMIAAGVDRARYSPLVVLPAAGPLADELGAAGIEVVVRPLSVLRRELMTPSGLAGVVRRAAADGLSLGRLIRSRRVALVHSNTSVVLSGAGAAGMARVPHVWHVREIYSRFGRLWPAYRRLLLSASALPCVSQAAAEQFGAAGGARVRVIHDGLAVPAARMEREPARAALGLDPASRVIAVVGRISEWKGQDVLVRALAEPELRARGAVGVIAGEAWPGAEHREAAVRELAGALGVLDRVRFLGFRENLDAVLGAADIVAVPSSAPDPLPGAAIEAAAAGCVVIAAAHGGLPEIIRDRQTGLLVAPGDPAALARAAAEVLDSPQLAERLGIAAARDVRGRFSEPGLLDGIAELYDSVLTSRS